LADFAAAAYKHDLELRAVAGLLFREEGERPSIQINLDVATTT
jgi:hypothetical protein